MSGVKDVFKNGWHSDKGTSLKQQVTGVFRKGEAERHTTHTARPLSQLKDPASFAPPPKHIAAHGGTPTVAPSTRLPRSGQAASSTAGGEEGDARAEPPPKPYRVNTTGLSTDNLPLPPRRRTDTGSTAAPAVTSPPRPYSPATAKPDAPSLPPRLPPRGVGAGGGSPPLPLSSPSKQAAASPTPIYTPTPSLNQGAVSRLGAAGISVPGFGIGRSASSSSSTPVSDGTTAEPPSSLMGGLQNRFAKMSTTASSNGADGVSSGTTLAQKQTALQTAANFRRDPTSVSLADAQSAASTANNFQRRHGDQVAAGLRTASSINQNYGVDNRDSGLTSHQQPPVPSRADTSSPSGSAHAATAKTPMGPIVSPVSPAAPGVLGKKRPPPPPPKKKQGLAGPQVENKTAAGADDDTPPPVPYATRPQF